MTINKKLAVLCAPLLLVGCASKPYNNFQHHHKAIDHAALGAGVASIGPAVIGSSVGTATIAGGAAGMLIGAYMDSIDGVLRQLRTCGVKVIQYGDTITAYVPTDHFYVFDTAELDENQYSALMNLVKLIKLYKYTDISIAGFTDEVGSDKHRNKLSENRAQTLLAFLWAHGIEVDKLSAEGHSMRFDVASNLSVEGSGMNRRVEVQWQVAPPHYSS